MTADALELVGFFLGAVALGAWAIVIKLGLEDEATRRAKGLNGLLKIQSYTNLTLYALMIALSVVGVVPFAFLLQVPTVLPTGDWLRDATVLVVRGCLIATNVLLLAVAVVFVQCRAALDRYQSVHGPHNRRATDPRVPDPPAISPVHGPL